MDFETYSRSKRADYAALAETVASILQAALKAYPGVFRLQQMQHRAKESDSLKKKLEDRGIQSTATLEADIKDLAGCRLIFYTNADVSRFGQTGSFRTTLMSIGIERRSTIRCPAAPIRTTSLFLIIT